MRRKKIPYGTECGKVYFRITHTKNLHEIWMIVFDNLNGGDIRASLIGKCFKSEAQSVLQHATENLTHKL